jgi:hypothetical protein
LQLLTKLINKKSPTKKLKIPKKAPLIEVIGETEIKVDENEG